MLSDPQFDAEDPARGIDIESRPSAARLLSELVCNAGERDRLGRKARVFAVTEYERDRLRTLQWE